MESGRPFSTARFRGPRQTNSNTQNKKDNTLNYYIECWKKYVEFSGRARRKEYWMFVLFNIIASIVAGVIDGLLGTRMIGSLYSLAVLLPGLAVCARRLHDTDRSGWWMLIALIPLVGWIVLLVFMCLDSTPGENRFGANPKGA